MRPSGVGIPELQLAVDPLGGSLEKKLYGRKVCIDILNNFVIQTFFQTATPTDLRPVEVHEFLLCSDAFCLPFCPGALI